MLGRTFFAVSLGQDVTGVGQRPREPVEVCDHEGVAGAAGGKGKLEPPPVSVRKGMAAGRDRERES